MMDSFLISFMQAAPEKVVSLRTSCPGVVSLSDRGLIFFIMLGCMILLGLSYSNLMFLDPFITRLNRIWNLS